MSQEQTPPAKWQPVILILQGRRLECHCGQLAIFITGKVSDEDYNCMDGVDVWCQDCFDKAQQEGTNTMGGKPSKGTKKDMRLARNKPKSAAPPARPASKATQKGMKPGKMMGY